eukprot:TRINITY_DN54721_c0_g1_i1.p1 TRINITY_DN54721_c0_g1~~TRINITY_DN54721_c0_g1_i1.p1  ORF type:complete len:536 (+),score=88.29 TRINITY_DN54721_c0_g1_i1:144-1751(+)
MQEEGSREDMLHEDKSASSDGEPAVPSENVRTRRVPSFDLTSTADSADQDQASPDSPISPASPSQGLRGGPTLVALFRHAERADTSSSVWQNAWGRSSDAANYPFDPPLTAAGIEQARQRAKTVALIAPCRYIRTSPYLRCVQTALIMAEELDATVEIDHRLGEVLSRQVCGDLDVQSAPWRPKADLLSALKDAELGHVYETSRLMLDHVRGEPPTWPESHPNACLRYASRFMIHLRRTLRTMQSCILISHGESIKACASVLPAACMWEMMSVDFCGGIIAEMPELKCKNTASKWQVSLHGIDCIKNNDFCEAAYLKRLDNIQRALGWKLRDTAKVIGEGFCQKPPVVHKGICEEIDDVDTDMRHRAGVNSALSSDNLQKMSGRRRDDQQSLQKIRQSLLSAPQAADVGEKTGLWRLPSGQRGEDFLDANREISNRSLESIESSCSVAHPFDQAVKDFKGEGAKMNSSAVTILNAPRSKNALLARRKMTPELSTAGSPEGGYSDGSKSTAGHVGSHETEGLTKSNAAHAETDQSP